MGVAASTQQRDPSRDVVVSAPPAAGAGCGWALFDPRAVTGGFGSSSAAHSPTAAASVTSNGASVRVSLHLEPPPRVSYVEVASCARFCEDSTVVAADGDLLLIHMLFDVGDESRSEYVEDFFVYKADPESPSLRRLPARPRGWTGGGMHAGIVRGGDVEFLVADLQTPMVNRGAGCWTYVTELLLYSSVADLWEVRRLDMPNDDDSGNVLRPSIWETDAAFTFGGLVYWADYHRGVLSCDVVAADPELRFVRFPGIEIPEDDDFRYGDRIFPKKYRTASIDSAGVLRFVDVDDSRDSSGEWGCVVIRTWSLRTPALGWMGWEEEHTLELDDALPALELDDVLPASWEGRVTPMFPVVSMQEDDVVHMVLRASAEAERWMATVDMRSRSLRSCEMLQRAVEGPEESDGDATITLGDTPLIWCEICKYVSP